MIEKKFVEQMIETNMYDRKVDFDSDLSILKGIESEASLGSGCILIQSESGFYLDTVVDGLYKVKFTKRYDHVNDLPDNLGKYLILFQESLNKERTWFGFIQMKWRLSFLRKPFYIIKNKIRGIWKDTKV